MERNRCKKSQLSTKLVWDFQYRLRCSRCEGFKISLRDERGRGDSAKAGVERVIVTWAGRL